MKLATLGYLLCAGQFAMAQGKLTPQSVDVLPSDVVSTAGEATLFVDWKPKEGRLSWADGTFTCYVINRSIRPIELNTSVGRLGLFYLEAKTGNATWERAQQHAFQTCGTGGDTLTLAPGHWVTFDHPIYNQPPGARKLPVRLRSYNDRFEVSSNAGHAMIHPGAVAWAKNDSLAISRASIERLTKVIYGRDPANRSAKGWRPREVAVRSLTRSDLDLEKSTAFLKLLSSGAIPDLQELATKVLNENHEDKDQ